MNWQLSSAQFMTLWEATDLDRMPHPLRHLSSARMRDELFLVQRALEQWRASLDDPRLDATIRTLRHPDLSVTVFGLQGDEDTAIRRRGSIRGRVAAVADQLPGTADRADIRLRATSATPAQNIAWLTQELLGNLPECLPGRTKSLTAHPDDVERRPSDSGSVLQNFQESDGTLIRRLRARPRDAIGYISIHGARDGLNEPVAGEMTWFDIADDGRYLHHEDRQVNIRAITPQGLREELARRLTALGSDVPSARSF